MTTNANTGPNIYTGNGSASEFDFTFEIKSASEILVTEVVIATGVETVLTLTTDYTVSIDPDETGSITLVAGALPSTKKIVLEPNLQYTQELDYNENDPFPAKTHESGLDKAVRLIKQLKVGLNRSVQQPSTSNTPVTLPTPEDGKALLWDSGELVNSTDDFDDIVTDATTQATTATTQAGIATTKASEASDDADAAAISEANAAASAARLFGTSTSSVAIGTGSKAFTTQADKFFGVGTWLLITSDANSANYMHGQVTAYSGTSLTVNVTNIGGSGTLADWTIRVAGTRGADALNTVAVALSISSSLVATDASLGAMFTLLANGNFTLSNPTNAFNGQKIIWRIKQDGTGSRILTLGNKFTVSSQIGSVVLSTAAGSIDHIGAIYNSTDDKFEIVAFSPEQE